MRASRSSSLPALAAVVLGAGLGWLLWQGPGSPPAEEAPVPDRVILFAPNLVESAWVLGYGERIVGITDYCVWPPELMGLPRVGGMLDPNLERILALQPQLLVVQGQSPRLRSFARSNGIPLAEIKMDDDLRSIFAGLARMDSLLGRTQSGAAPRVVAAIRAQLRQVSASVHGRSHPEVLLVLGHEPGSLESLFTTGAGTFLAELLSLAGARPYLADERRGYGNLGLETLVARPPAIAIEVVPRDALLEVDDVLRPWRQLGLTGVRVEVLPFDGAMIPGPRIGELAQRLRDLIHPGVSGSTAQGQRP